ncbi:MAG: methyltransferase domain-containing protein [Clostridiales bacterium]|jgi:DNA modification methylase|nr:methyltransferase domain-containing protein [Clostridiales bacterium]
MRWEPENFLLETTSIWSFPKRGSWATHNAKYRGNWSPYIPRNLLLRYSSKNDLILDQFAGGGTTLIEAKLLGRHSIGVDVNPLALDCCREKTSFEYPDAGRVYIKRGDARKLDFIPPRSVDFICTHPPYADIVKYSGGLDGDLSNYGAEDFLIQMIPVAAECFRVLRPGKFCAVLMGDIREKGRVVPMGFKVMKVFEENGFHVKEIIVKEQHNCRATGYWKEKSVKHNFLLLAHEHLFVFKK